jgi:hypothetical protein
VGTDEVRLSEMLGSQDLVKHCGQCYEISSVGCDVDYVL